MAINPESRDRFLRMLKGEDTRWDVDRGVVSKKGYNLNEKARYAHKVVRAKELRSLAEEGRRLYNSSSRNGGLGSNYKLTEDKVTVRALAFSNEAIKHQDYSLALKTAVDLALELAKRDDPKMEPYITMAEKMMGKVICRAKEKGKLDTIDPVTIEWLDHYLGRANKDVSPIKKGGLENAATAVAIIGVAGGLFFLSPNFTGGAISVNTATSNIIGLAFFAVALVGGFFWWRSKRKLNHTEKKSSGKRKLKKRRK